MPTDGWIKLHRKIMDSAVWTNPDLFHLWICCLLKANHKAAWVSVHGLAEPVRVLPGQFITGRNALHELLYPKHKRKVAPSPITVWRRLRTLSYMANLSLETNKRFTLVTIVNWETYQNDSAGGEQANDQPVNNRRSAGEQPVITNKNVKKEEKEKNENKKQGVRDYDSLPVFTAWWTAWPQGNRKVGKPKCFDRWQRGGLEAYGELIVRWLAHDKATEQWTKDNGQFVPMPMTWLNREPWADGEPPEGVRDGKTSLFGADPSTEPPQQFTQGQDIPA